MKLLYNEVNEKIRIQIDVEVWSHVSEQLFGKIHIKPLKRNIWNQ
jgi:hypothetical protein